MRDYSIATSMACERFSGRKHINVWYCVERRLFRMIVDKNGNELQVGDMVRFTENRNGPYVLGVIEFINESTSLFLRCIGPLQHVIEPPQNVELVTSLDDQS